jgi:hypothetical protein
VDEMYRILGREHQADLEREAQRRDLAAAMTKTTTVDSQRVTQLLLGAALSVRRRLRHDLQRRGRGRLRYEARDRVIRNDIGGT